MLSSRPEKINQKLTQERAKRIRKLMTQSGMLQATLAERVGYTPQHFSAMLNGRKPFSVYVAKRIAKEFPPVRFQWIMVDDNFETDNDVLLFATRQKLKMYSGVESLLSGCGIDLVVTKDNEDLILELGEHSENDSSSLNIESLPNECRFSFKCDEIGECVGDFSKQEIMAVFEDIADYAVFKVRKLIEAGGRGV